MPITFKRSGREAITLEALSFKGVDLDKVTFKKTNQEAVTVFESKPLLPAPQNVTADGTVVSWDEVENATEYEVYADGTSIGTVKNSETWLLNETVNAPKGWTDTSVAFSSNGQNFTAIHFDTVSPSLIISYDNALVYDREWEDEAYRTITFETAPTGDLLAWLQANGVKQ